jgi:hypothetical protein
MKLEMGESLAVSYLKHILGCQVVQLNWKISSKWPLSHTDDAILDTLCSEDPFLGPHFDKLYVGKAEEEEEATSPLTVGEFLRQGEIDVLGIKFTGGQVEKIVAVDSAFHLNGVGYGNLQTNIARIYKKLIRSAYTIKLYFGQDFLCESLFITPFTRSINEAQKMKVFFEDLQNSLGDERLQLKFYSDEDFRKDILLPLLDGSVTSVDTSELFYRSAMLIKHSFKDIGNALNQKVNKVAKAQAPELEPQGQKIGAYMKEQIEKLINEGYINSRNIEALTTKEGTQHLFKLTLPLFSRQRSERYYKVGYTTIVAGETFYLNSQWFEGRNHQENLNRWRDELFHQKSE